MSWTDIAKQGRILIVDDAMENIQILHQALQDEQEVLFAMDGPRALHIAQHQLPDVILLDAMMPRESGPEVLREMRARSIETPVLIVSAHEEEAADRANGPKANGYIRKPIDFDLLLGRIAELLADGDGSAQS